MALRRSAASLFFVIVAVACCCCCGVTYAGSADDWRGRVIYQVLTDRFAHSANDKMHQKGGSSLGEEKVAAAASSCPDLRDYCGGSFAGIIEKLDYIQSMGFDAIWISPVVSNIDKGEIFVVP